MDPRPFLQPLIVGFELYSQLTVMHAEEAIRSPLDGLGNHVFHLLSDHADIGFVAAIVTEAIDAEAVWKPADEDDVVLEADIGSPPAAAPTATTAAVHAATAGSVRAAGTGMVRDMCARAATAVARSGPGPICRGGVLPVSSVVSLTAA
jgi:hypothetical protein